ncbi:putative nuclease HARBI1 [Rhinatrema bivittatum]|uniref:putative nuclease HARBI1 n=1 Tax=Rhinatrema bivittatum TaxID=194408 RepID=UPI0011280FE4|nr:putative nuclease HARBI1 [Rhinatrema bivittatum]
MSEPFFMLKRMKERRKRRRFYPEHRVYRDRHSFLDLTEEQVLRQYRLDKQAIHDLCLELGCDLESSTGRSHALPVAVKVTSALMFLATGSFQTTTRDRTGISQSAMSNCLAQFLEALVKRAGQYICFPRSDQHLQQTIRGFRELSGFPDVLGAVGCLHVALRAPSENEQAYRNSRSFHSMNMQVVCDAHCAITNVVAKYPGSCLNAYILEQSALARLLNGGEINGVWLVGDRSYPPKQWLMTPILYPSTPAEEKYNEMHRATRCVIQRTFAFLKARFCCLDRASGALQYSPQKVCQIFLACCILHNIAVSRGMPLELEGAPQEESDSEADSEALCQNAILQASSAASDARSRIVALFQ